MARPLIKVWLDDIRPAPEGWVGVKNVETAKRELMYREVEAISLDHDLGNDPGGDGSRLILWMAEHNIWSRTKPVCHSMNPVGREYIEGVVARHWPGIDREVRKRAERAAKKP